MADYLELSDTLNGSEGTGYITIDGTRRRAFELTKIELDLVPEITNKKVMGNRITQNKVKGMKIEGSMTYYWVDSAMLDLAQEYIKNGKQPYFDVQFKNDDPGADIGTNEVLATGVLLDKIPLARLDVDSSDPVTIDTSIVANDYKMLNKFKLPSIYR